MYLKVIIGLECIIVKKHPVLVAFWILWIFFMLSFTIFANVPVPFVHHGFMGSIVTILQLLLLVVLIITTIRTCRVSKKK